MLEYSYDNTFRTKPIYAAYTAPAPSNFSTLNRISFDMLFLGRAIIGFIADIYSFRPIDE